MIKIANKKLIVNVSDSRENYSQRNNEYKWFNGNIKVDSNTTCNVTSMAMALDYCGYQFPASAKFKQPEDALAAFIMTSRDVDDYYRQKAPEMYAPYKAGVKNSYTPNEVHTILSFAVNQWLGCNATYFSQNVSIFDMYKELLEGRPLVISGLFNKLNHITCLVGCEWDIAESNMSIADQVSARLEKFYTPTAWIMDDPYGDFRTGYKTGSGNDIKLSHEEFINMLKPLGNPITKWAHRFNQPAAII